MIAMRDRSTNPIAVVLGVLAFAALAGACRAGAAGRDAEKGAAMNKWAKHYYDRLARFRRENAAAKNIVLVGSSHIEGFDTDEHLPGRRFVNRGIASDRIGITERGILHRLDESVFDCNPGYVVLENGVNDLGELWRHGTPSIDQIDACYRKVVKAIRQRLPATPLLIVGLFPTRGRYADLNPYVRDFNGRLEKIAADYGCAFMDVYKPFADEAGQLREGFSRDGLHLTAAGYALWARMLDKVLPPPGTGSQPAASKQ
jgi:lysophospholipase L1-like esterase